MFTKEKYQAPETELFELKLETPIMELSYGEEGSAGAQQSYQMYEEDF